MKRVECIINCLIGEPLVSPNVSFLNMKSWVTDSEYCHNWETNRYQ